MNGGKIMNIMDYSCDMSERAYNQEINREKTIITKTDYLFKWLTIIIAIFNIIIPIVVSSTGLNIHDDIFVRLYISIMIVLLLAIVLTIIISLPKKIKRYPMGSEFLKEINKNPDKYKDVISTKYYNILYIDTMVINYRKKNNQEIFLIFIVDLLLVVSFILMAVIFIYMNVNGG